MKWTTQQRKVSDLIPYAANPRQMTDKQNKYLTKSLEKFDLVEIPAINTDGTILAGHQRLRIMQTLGRGDEVIDVRVPDRLLTEKEVQEYNIRSNKNTGEFDFDILANSFDTTDLLEWGFDEKDLKIQLDIEEDDFDTTPPVEPVTKVGDLYQLGDHRLLCGDATKAEDVERLMNGKKADMVFTDPPYGVSYQSNMRMQSEKFSVIDGDEKIDETGIVTAFAHSVGWVLMCTSWKVLKQWLDALEPLGEPQNIIIWDKGGGGIGDLKHSLLTDYEVILAYNRGAEITGKMIGSVWDVGKDSAIAYEHPTQKPVGLSTLAMQTFCQRNSTVLDLYGGSGSTLIACEQLNRHCYMMEIDPGYCDVIVNRWETFTGKKAELSNG